MYRNLSLKPLNSCQIRFVGSRSLYICKVQTVTILWVASQRLQDDELGDDPLLDELKKLRRYIFHWHGM